MPSLYLDKTDRDRQIAQAVKQIDAFVELKEAEKVLILLSDGIMRINRKRLEAVLGEPLSDDEWKQKFKRAVGQVEYTDREFILTEEPPGDS